MSAEEPVTYIGKTNHRNAGVLFGIREKDRRSHFYIVGKTGTGKSHLLRNMICQDICAGRGCALFDPHGDLVSSVQQLIPQQRQKDLVYLELPNPALHWRFNPLAGIDADRRPLAAAGLVEVFKKLWPDDWGPRLEHLLRNVVFTLLEISGSTLADIPQLLSDRSHRNGLVSQLANPSVRNFWFDEFNNYSPAFRAVVVAPLQNKLGALLTDPTLHRFLTEPGEQIDLRRLMDAGKIVLVNLDKGRIGEGPATAIGSFLLSHIALAGIARSSQPEEGRRDFFVYLDEFQTFTTHSLASMLSELRKYRVSLILAHQHLSQLEPEIRDAVFGNVGSIVAFRVGAADASYLSKEFAPVFSASDLIALPRYHFYIRLQIDHEQSRPFSAVTLPFSITQASGFDS